MKTLLTTLCLTIAVLLGSMGMSESADFQKGLTAYTSGDYATALREWKPLAEKNDARAQSLLGFMYRMGQGVPVNPIVAAKWYTLAAAQGVASAQYSLGMMYLQGIGVTRNLKLAKDLFLKSAEQGNADAQNNLGLIYANGFGVPKDKTHGLMWWYVAEISGSKNAASGKSAISKLMQPQEIAKAQKLARECVRKKYKGC